MVLLSASLTPCTPATSRTCDPQRSATMWDDSAATSALSGLLLVMCQVRCDAAKKNYFYVGGGTFGLISCFLSQTLTQDDR